MAVSVPLRICGGLILNCSVPLVGREFGQRLFLPAEEGSAFAFRPRLDPQAARQGSDAGATSTETQGRMHLSCAIFQRDILRQLGLHSLLRTSSSRASGAGSCSCCAPACSPTTLAPPGTLPSSCVAQVTHARGAKDRSGSPQHCIVCSCAPGYGDSRRPCIPDTLASQQPAAHAGSTSAAAAAFTTTWRQDAKARGEPPPLFVRPSTQKVLFLLPPAAGVTADVGQEHERHSPLLVSHMNVPGRLYLRLR